MSKKNNSVTPVVEEEQVVVEETVTVEPEIVETPEVVEEPMVEAEPEFIVGVVANCAKLNVREMMHAQAKVLCVLPASAEVQVVADEHHDDWYHVFTESGIEGFCMKQYISIKA